LRAATKSRCQALASLSDKSTFLNASANSGPVQPFLAAGTRRATGMPFFSRTKAHILIMDAIHAIGEFAGGLGHRNRRGFHGNEPCYKRIARVALRSRVVI
jgi:hypothetical protein